MPEEITDSIQEVPDPINPHSRLRPSDIRNVLRALEAATA